ncbi:hypothetical protein D3C78_1168090 [compost metagenome]
MPTDTITGRCSIWRVACRRRRPSKGEVASYCASLSWLRIIASASGSGTGCVGSFGSIGWRASSWRRLSAKTSTS